MSDGSSLWTDSGDTGIPNENLECLRALFLTNPQDDLAAIRSAKGDRVDGTCEWVLTQHQYSSWLVEGSPQLLWLSGAPGIGKTVISSFLVEELTPIAERSWQMTLAYYFCDDKHQERRTAAAILRGLLLQILRQRPVLFKHIQTSFEMSGDSLFTNFHGLWRIFFATIHDPEMGEVCCLVDALDECEKDSRQLFLFEFAKLFRPQQSRRTSVKFIITSRRENDIVESLFVVSPAIRHLQIDSGKVNNDLSKFIDVKVDVLSRLKGYNLELKEKIKFTLTEKAGGTFLFVSLVLHDLKMTKATFQVQQKLRELPSDLNKLYDGILSNIDADCQEIAKLVLCWVALASRPLTVEEFAMALILGPGRWEENSLPPEDVVYEFRDAYRCCEPLVNLDIERGTINLVHQSAKDYLLGAYLQAKGNLSQYHIVQDCTNLIMFRTCWKFLSFEEFRQGTMIFERDARRYLHQMYHNEEPNDKHCFLQYALRQWQEHAFAASPALATDIMFLKKDLARSPTLRDALLLSAAAKGEYMIVQRLLENGAQINSRDTFGSTALLLASQGGHEKVLELLLEWLNAATSSPHLGGQIPSYEAAEAGHTTVVKSLLSQDYIGVNSKDNFGRTPLSLAAKNGHEAVVKMLLSLDHIAVNSQNGDGDTPLSCAARNGHEAVVKLLLSHDDIAINSQNEDNDTPLSCAARNGHQGVVRLLLSRDDIDVNLRELRGRTSLSRAVEYGYEGVVRLLFTRTDIDVNIRDNKRRTALTMAVLEEVEEVVRLLLGRNDIDVNSQDKDGQTALMWAVRRMYKEGVVRLLLSRNDIDVNSQDKDGQTALIWAVWHEENVRLLLGRNDIDVNIRDKGGQTALIQAVRYGHEGGFRLLLSRSDIEVTSQDLEEAQRAKWQGEDDGHHAIMKLLEQKMDESKEAAAQ